MWLYHSHVNEMNDVNAGLVGAILVTARGKAKPDGSRTDVVALSPAQMFTVDMVPDDPGIWLYHCHVSDHMEAGMIARYQVLP